MTDQPKESAIEQVITKFIETACVLGISVENGSIVLQARAELAAKDAELAELRAKLADLEGIDKVCDAAHEQIVLLQNDVDTLQAKLQPLACGHLRVEFVWSKPISESNPNDTGTDDFIGQSGYCRRCRELEEVLNHLKWALSKIEYPLVSTPEEYPQHWKGCPGCRVMWERDMKHIANCPYVTANQAVKGASR